MRAALDARPGGEAGGFATFAAYFPEVVPIHESDIGAAQRGLAQQQRLGVVRLSERYGRGRERKQKDGEGEHSLLHRAVSWRMLNCFWMIRLRGRNRFNGD